MIVKAISLHQPWASLIAARLKRWETRSWGTKYRGPLLICASKHRMPDYDAVMLYREMHVYEHEFPYNRLPFGKAVCIVDLTACVSTDEKNRIWGNDLVASDLPFGDFGPARFAWRLKNVRTFTPFPVRGRLGLFDIEVPDHLVMCPFPDSQLPRE